MAGWGQKHHQHKRKIMSNKIGCGFNPNSVTVEIGKKVGVSVYIPTGAKLVKIETPDCIEGWPVDVINAERWGSVNGVKAGTGEIVFTLDDGTATQLPVTVIPSATTDSLKDGRFVIDLYLPGGAHLRGEADLKLVD